MDINEKAQNIARELAEWTSLLSANSPLLYAAVGFVQSIIENARREAIDPGPFETILVSIKQKIADGLSADAAYRERHGE